MKDKKMVWHIEEMCGREIAVKPYEGEIGEHHGKHTRIDRCMDCGRPTQIVVNELGRLPLHGPQPRIWGWCGECQIG